MKHVLIGFILIVFTAKGCSPWETNNEDIFYNSGTVGIGTDNPAEGVKLHVFSEDGSAGLPLLLVQRTEAEGPIWGIQEWHNADGEIMRVTYQGHLGVGEKQPREKLVVNGNVLIKENNGLILTSPSGKEFKITVDDQGNLSASEIITSD